MGRCAYRATARVIPENRLTRRVVLMLCAPIPWIQRPRFVLGCRAQRCERLFWGASERLTPLRHFARGQHGTNDGGQSGRRQPIVSSSPSCRGSGRRGRNCGRFPRPPEVLGHVRIAEWPSGRQHCRPPEEPLELSGSMLGGPDSVGGGHAARAQDLVDHHANRGEPARRLTREHDVVELLGGQRAAGAGPDGLFDEPEAGLGGPGLAHRAQLEERSGDGGARG